jgi:uncharacterized protein YoxC
MFCDQLDELNSLVKSVIKEDNEMYRKFYKHLESIVDEDDIIDELMEKWNRMIDEPSYHDLRALLKKRLNIENDSEIDENVKLNTCYWADKCECITENSLSLHAHNCHNGQMWYAKDLDNYFGFELYRYELIVGGPKHGTFIVNGKHEDNENEEDIEIKLDDFNQKFECIENLNKFVQDANDKNGEIHKRNIKHKKNFELYRQKIKVKKITEVYILFKTKYHMIIGYNKSSTRKYDVFKRKIQDLTTEASELLSINNNYDEDLKKLCEELIHILSSVDDDMKNWYNIVEEGINTKFNEDVSKYICDFI